MKKLIQQSVWLTLGSALWLAFILAMLVLAAVYPMITSPERVTGRKVT